MPSPTDVPDGAPVGRDSEAPLPAARRTSNAFGSPGTDSTVKRINLNDALIRHPDATFVMRAAGILLETGLPTSVGFGATKTLAKLANHVGKTADRKAGSYPSSLAQVCDFSRLAPHELDAIFAATEAGSVWGVGRKIAARARCRPTGQASRLRSLPLPEMGSSRTASSAGGDA